MPRFLVTALALLTVACTTPPERVQAVSVPVSHYTAYDCELLRQERVRVLTRLNTLASMQRKQANKDAWTVAAGVGLYAPALVLLAGADVKKQLAQAKGEHFALEEAARGKGCPTAA